MIEKVLFICRGNVGRSQMAEAFFRELYGKNTGIGACSAGTHVREREGRLISNIIVDCMNELGYDLSECRRTQLTEEMYDDADRVVVISNEDLPNYLFKYLPKLRCWFVEDGKGRSYEFHCQIRDQIKERVEKLIVEIEEELDQKEKILDYLTVLS